MNTAFPCMSAVVLCCGGSQTGESWLNFSATPPQEVRRTPMNEKWARSRAGSRSLSKLDAVERQLEDQRVAQAARLRPEAERAGVDREVAAAGSGARMASSSRTS